MTAKKQDKQERPEKKVKFEEAMGQLEAIVSDLEGGTLGLDDALEKYEEGIRTLKACYAILQQAEKRIEVLTRKPDGSFDAEEAGEPDEGEKPKPSKPRKTEEEPGGLFRGEG